MYKVLYIMEGVYCGEEDCPGGKVFKTIQQAENYRDYLVKYAFSDFELIEEMYEIVEI